VPGQQGQAVTSAERDGLLALLQAMSMPVADIGLLSVQDPPGTSGTDGPR
jgi:hypothetical protein